MEARVGYQVTVADWCGRMVTVQQNALTVLVPVTHGREEELDAHLRLIGADVRQNPYLQFGRSPSTHFARFVCVPAHGRLGSRLLFTSNHDGDLESYVRELSSQLGTGMDQIWSYCAGYQPGDAHHPQRLMTFFLQHALPTQAFYVACRGASVGAIQKANQLREDLDRDLDDPKSQRYAEWHSMFQGYETAPAGLPANSGAPSPDALLSRVVEWLVGVKRGAQQLDRRVDARPDQMDAEDRVVQNQMTILSPIKRDPWHRLLIRIVLWLANARAAKTHGSLSGLTTIHFARWVIIEGGDTLLFESNYDGSWENYINDFVDFASVGMNAIWANCVDFPVGGARDIEAFKEIIRRYQVPAQVFYSAYPYSTVRNNLYNLRLADALQQPLPNDIVARFVSGSYRLDG